MVVYTMYNIFSIERVAVQYHQTWANMMPGAPSFNCSKSPYINLKD